MVLSKCKVAWQMCFDQMRKGSNNRKTQNSGFISESLVFHEQMKMQVFLFCFCKIWGNLKDKLVLSKFL